MKCVEHSLRRGIAAVLVLCLAASPALAGTLKLKNGETVECVLFERNKDTLIVESDTGFRSFQVQEIESFNGAPVLPMPTEPSGSAYPRTERVVAGPLAKIDPATYTDDRALEFYNAHREEFRTPVSIHLKAVEFFQKPPASEIEKIRSRPGDTVWKDMGWVERGGPMGDRRVADLFGENADTVFDLKKDEVSGLLRSGAGAYYVFMAVERKEPRVPPYDEIRGKVKSVLMDRDGQALKRSYPEY